MTIEDIALQMTPGIGVKGAVHLLECFETAERIFEASESELIGRAELRREIPDYPHVIYVKGDPQTLAARTLSIVGTREMTPYGQSICHKLVERLAERVPRLVIVSGLAFGIDAAAHRAALDCKIPTAAVLPVESPDNGGSLLTARFADEYNRTVMALPGRATDRSAAGTNHLIRHRKAQLVLSAEDIIVEMGWDLEAEPAALRPRSETTDLTSDETALLALFRSSDPIAIDALQTATGFDPGRLATSLLSLELAGLLRQLPGNRYMKP